MKVIVLIGDVVRSKALPERNAFQQLLAGTLADVTKRSPSVISPYTITLGDEFQAVYRRPERLFANLFTILAEIYPAAARFSIGFGELTTPINKRQALGMDGPPFHRARDALTALKRSKGLFHIAAPNSKDWAISNHALNLLSYQVVKWEKNRLMILAQLLSGKAAPEIAQQLGISKPALYKNIHAAGLGEVVNLCEGINRAIDTALHAP